jgi:uncharacterized protein with HEPN domain
MPKRSLNLYLCDIIETIETLQEHFRDVSVDDLRDVTKKWAIERGISIIGEAVYKLNDLKRGLPISNLTNIIATRHIVIHEYEYVNSAILVDIINVNLPVLKIEVENILKNIVTSNNE